MTLTKELYDLFAELLKAMTSRIKAQEKRSDVLEAKLTLLKYDVDLIDDELNKRQMR